MGVYDREWYRKEAERRQRRQEGADAMWNEVEPTHRAKNTASAYNSKQHVPSSKPREKTIPTYCPHCDYAIQLRIPSWQLNSYSYVCPSCKRKISVKTTTKTDKIITTILYILGIPAVALIFFAGIDSLLKLIF